MRRCKPPCFRGGQCSETQTRKQKDKQWTIQETLGKFPRIRSKSRNKMQQKKGQDDCQRRKKEKAMERKFEQSQEVSNKKQWRYIFLRQLTLHTETTLTRADRKVHAILVKTTRWRSQALTFTLLSRGHLIHPSQAVKYYGIKTVRRVLRERTDLQEVVKNLMREKENKEEQRAESDGASFSDTLSDRLVITRRHGTTMHLTIRPLAQRSDLVQQ